MHVLNLSRALQQVSSWRQLVEVSSGRHETLKPVSVDQVVDRVYSADYCQPNQLNCLMGSQLSSRKRYTPSNNIAGIKSKSSPYLCLQNSDCGYFVLRMRGRPPSTPPHKPKQQNGKKNYFESSKSAARYDRKKPPRRIATSKPFCLAWLQYFSKCST